MLVSDSCKYEGVKEILTYQIAYTKYDCERLEIPESALAFSFDLPLPCSSLSPLRFSVSMIHHR